jgi:hypothetical protein
MPLTWDVDRVTLAPVETANEIETGVGYRKWVMSAKGALMLSEKDNVAMAIEDIVAGLEVSVRLGREVRRYCMSFLGYARPNGSVGIRNHVLVIPGRLLAAKICNFVAGTTTILTSDSGSGRTSQDRETIARTLIGLGTD